MSALSDAFNQEIAALGGEVCWLERPDGQPGVVALVAVGNETITMHRPTRRQCIDWLCDVLQERLKEAR